MARSERLLRLAGAHALTGSKLERRARRLLERAGEIAPWLRRGP